MAYQPKSYRKFLATTVTASLVATAVAPAALAASNFTDVSANYEAAVSYLVENNITSGLTETTFGTTANITRGDAAVLVANALGLDLTQFEAAPFTDVNARQAGAVSALYALNIINGKTETEFKPGENITRQEMAKVIANAFELVGAGEELPFTDVNSTFAPFVDALFTKGITTGKTETSFGSTQAITRGEFAIFLFRALTGVEVVVAAEVKAATANTSKSLKVDFTSAVDASDLTFSVKRGSTIVGVTATFSEDKKSVVLSAPVKLVAGDYTVTVNGLKEGKNNVATVKVAAETATTLEIVSEVITISNTSKVEYVVKNQYGEAMVHNTSDVIESAYDATAGTDNPAGAIGSLDISSSQGKYYVTGTFGQSSVKHGDEILVTLTYKGLTASKKVVAQNAGALKSLVLNTPSPLKDKERITAGETIELPYVATDQYGKDFKLSAATDSTADNQFVYGDYVFSSSNTSVVDVDDFVIDSKGKLTFKALAKGTTKITVVNVKTAEISSVDVEVFAGATADSIDLVQPTSLIVDGETTKVSFNVYDQFGGVVKLESLNTGDVKLASSKTGVATVAWDGKEIVITGTGEGTTEISATIGTKVTKFTIDVQPEAEAYQIVGVKNLPTLFEDTATSTFTFANLLVKDQYGRDYALKAGDSVAVSHKDTTANNVTFAINGDADANLESGETLTFTGTADKNAETVTFKLANDATYDVTLASVATADISTYEISEVGTLRATTGSDAYDYTLTLTGKTSDGKVVALKSGKVDRALSSNSAVATVNGLVVNPEAKGTTTITLYSGATKLDDITITVSDAAPVATTLKIAGSSYTATYHATAPTTVNLGAQLTVLDQYGVNVTSVEEPKGFWAVSDTTLATVDQNGVVTATAAAAGTNKEVTVKFVSTNGLEVTKVVKVK